jgi:2'-5' RNA ligase
MLTYEAALILPVPEAEPFVDQLRAEHDPSAAVGVPAHITVNYPFVPGVGPGERRLAELSRLFAGSHPFSFHLTRVERFPEVVYLAPEPVEPLVALIERVAQQYPDSPPYGGQYDTIVPHLTVAQSDNPEELREVEQRLAEIFQGVLPLSTMAKAVWLMDDRDGQWKRRREFVLGSP